jgi:Zn-dependent peptidase ImmA (M78 family)
MVPVQKIARQFAHVLGQTLPDEISGVLVPLASPLRGKVWTIVYNSHHSRVRQRFTIAHELGHLLLHSFTVPHADHGFKLRFRNAESSEGSVLEEIEANQFAAELLMPRELVVAEAGRLGLDYADPDGEDLAVLAETFKVSKLAISIRVGNLAGVVA